MPCSPRAEPPILRALRVVLPRLDGAFTLCGMTGDGWAFAVRDAHGIRPGWYHISSRVVAVASERPAIQAAFDVPPEAVRELPPGEALLISPLGEVRFERVLQSAAARPCSFERIYFSRANDADIQRQRRALGAALLPQVLEAAHAPLENIFFSYIPNSAQIAFHGLLAELFHRQERLAQRPQRPQCEGIQETSWTLRTSCETVVPRFGQIAVKDAKFRTFIADAAARREIGRHVYDVVYGLVRPGIDTLVVLDDSIVRGTTMREAILPMLDRLGPRRIVVASSAPPIRYPDCYGIDMSTLGELVAFQALVNLLGHAAEAELRAALENLSHAEFAGPFPHAEFAGPFPHAEFAGPFPHAEFAESAEFDSHAESAENAELGPAGDSHAACLGSAYVPFAPNAAAGGFEREQSELRTRAKRASNVGNAGFEPLNPLASLYARFPEEQHSAEIARLLTPPGMRAEVCVVFQTVPALHTALSARGTEQLPSNGGEAALERAQSALGTPAQPTSKAREARFGDWYFTGDYPTPGGYRVLRTALANYLDHNVGRSY